MEKRAPILLEDDDTTLLKLYSKLLGRFNEPVVALSEGLEAMRLVWQIPPLLVLLDVVMPEMDGFTLCRQIRKAVPYPVPILFMTGDDSLSTAIDGLSAGGDDFMIKGVAVADYLWRVNFWLRTPLPGLTASQRARALHHAEAMKGQMKPTDPIISNEFLVDEPVQSGLIALAKNALAQVGPDFVQPRCHVHYFLSYLLGAAESWCGGSLALTARTPAYFQAALDAAHCINAADARDFFRKLPLIEQSDQHRRAFAAGRADAELFAQDRNATLNGLALALV